MSAVIKTELTDDQILERRLLNWADWARQTGHRQGRCGSAERGWRPTYPDPEPVRTMDTEDAQKVEAAICQLSPEHRGVLVGMYVYRENWLVTIRRAIGKRNLDYWVWLRWVAAAKSALKMKLD